LTEQEDYTAGEINDPQAVRCGGRWVGKARFHMLSHLGPTWATSPPRFKPEQILQWTRGILEAGGVVTWDVPIQPTGVIPQPFIDQLKALPEGLATTGKRGR
jgi:hypothetical protein